jgi:hypothetical protein
LAVEHGYRSWPAFKQAVAQADANIRSVGRISASPSATYAAPSDRLLALLGTTSRLRLIDFAPVRA